MENNVLSAQLKQNPGNTLKQENTGYKAYWGKHKGFKGKSSKYWFIIQGYEGFTGRAGSVEQSSRSILHSPRKKQYKDTKLIFPFKKNTIFLQTLS